MRKIIILFVALIFAFSLGIAYAEEDGSVNPWQRPAQTSVKKEDKTTTKAVKTNKKEGKKTKTGKAKKKNTETAKKNEADKKE